MFSFKNTITAFSLFCLAYSTLNEETINPSNALKIRELQEFDQAAKEFTQELFTLNDLYKNFIEEIKVLRYNVELLYFGSKFILKNTIIVSYKLFDKFRRSLNVKLLNTYILSDTNKFIKKIALSRAHNSFCIDILDIKTNYISILNKFNVSDEYKILWKMGENKIDLYYAQGEPVKMIAFVKNIMSDQINFITGIYTDIDSFAKGIISLFKKCEQFGDIWHKLSYACKYFIFYGLNNEKLEEASLKFNENLFDKKIQELKEAKIKIMESHEILKESNVTEDNLDEVYDLFQYIYNYELFIYKSDKLMEFIRKNMSKNSTNQEKYNFNILKNISEDKLGKYLQEIEDISNEIKIDYDLKNDMFNIWFVLFQALESNEKILDNFIESKRNQLMKNFEEENHKMILFLSQRLNITKEEAEYFNNSIIYNYFNPKLYICEELMFHCYYEFLSSDILLELSLISIVKNKLLYDTKYHRNSMESDKISYIIKNFNFIDQELESSLMLEIFYNIFKEDECQRELYLEKNYEIEGNYFEPLNYYSFKLFKEKHSELLREENQNMLTD